MHAIIKPDSIFYKIDKNQKLIVKIADFDCVAILTVNQFLKSPIANPELKKKINKIRKIKMENPCATTESLLPPNLDVSKIDKFSKRDDVYALGLAYFIFIQ